MRYPKLAMMRAQRQRLEDEISAPHRAAAARSTQIAREERAAREGLERIMRSKAAPHIIEHLGREMGHGFYTEIMKAMHSIGSVTGTTTITVPTGMLLSCDRDSIVSKTVEWWKAETMPRMSFAAYKGEQEIKSGVTVIDVRVPELRYRHRMADTIL